jgi:hypothetical protein
MRPGIRLLLLAAVGGAAAGLPILLWPAAETTPVEASQPGADRPLGPDRPRGQLPGARTPQVLLAWSGGGSGIDVLGGQSPGAARTLTLTNTGTRPSLSLDGAVHLWGEGAIHLRMTENTCTTSLLPGEACQITVVPVATSDGAYAATLTVLRHNAPSLLLSGIASGFSPQPRLDGGATLWSAPTAIGVRNLGGGQASGLAFRLTGDAPERFRILGHTCPRQLDPGEACEVIVEADGADPAEARLEVLLDGVPRHGVPLIRVPSPEALSR